MDSEKPAIQNLNDKLDRLNMIVREEGESLNTYLDRHYFELNNNFTTEERFTRIATFLSAHLDPDEYDVMDIKHFKFVDIVLGEALIAFDHAFIDRLTNDEQNKVFEFRDMILKLLEQSGVIKRKNEELIVIIKAVSRQISELHMKQTHGGGLTTGELQELRELYEVKKKIENSDKN